MYIKEKNWEKALNDFKIAIELNPTKGLGYIGQGDCLRMMGEHEEAIALYTSVLSKENYLWNVGMQYYATFNLFHNLALLKRSIGYIEIKKYDEALDDLEYVRTNLFKSFKNFKGFEK